MRKKQSVKSGFLLFLGMLSFVLFFPGQLVAETRGPLALGKAVFEAKCGRCHSLTKGLTVIQTRSEWKKTVKKMVAYGADLKRKERKNVVQYLSARSLFDRSCSLCHELGQVVTDDSATRNWEKTIGEMGNHFKDVEFKEKVVGKQPPTKKEQQQIVQLLKVLLAE